MTNTPRNQTNINKLILCLLKSKGINNITTHNQANGIRIGRLVLTSVQDAKRYVEALKEVN
jgi:hypothetical protein